MSATPLATSFLQAQSFLDVLYIVAFGLFIQGLRGLSGPTTAVRGNRTAAVGMAIAVIATLLNRNEGNWGLIALGIAIGTAVGVPAARQVKMTAMPQMVALFNGVGGGAVFLISWSEFRLTHGYTGTATYITIFSLFAAIVGSVSFWGSNIAFGKLQEVITGRPITLGAAQQIVNLLLLVLAVAAAIDIASGDHSQGIFIGMLVCAALLGNAVVLPIGGVKEKVLGAKRAGIREVILPAENEPNVLEDLQPEMLEGVQIHFVRTVEEALEIALGKFEKPVRPITGGPRSAEDRPIAGPLH